MTVARKMALIALLAAAPLVRADPPAPPAAAAPATTPATRAAVGKLPHITVDAKQREVRVDAEAVKAEYPLEFLAVVANTHDYEAVVRTEAKPSDLHLALLMIGLKSGTPIHYDEATKAWLPPTGAAVDVWFEYQKDGKPVRIPAYRWMRDVRSKKEPTQMTWVFTGSRMMEENHYAADASGGIIGVINNELSVLDVPALKSGSMEAREYERNADLIPPTGTPVTMVLAPAAVGDKLPGGTPLSPPHPTTRLGPTGELPTTRPAR